MLTRALTALTFVAVTATTTLAQDPERTYFEFQVTKPARQAPVTRGPKYPPDLRAAGTNGEVLAQFIVDTSGAPVMSSFRILKSSHGAFSEAILAWLPDARYEPAEVNGKKVRQLVQQPFVFAVASKDGTGVSSPPPANVPANPFAAMNLGKTPAPRSGKVDGWMYVTTTTMPAIGEMPAQTLTSRLYGSPGRVRMQVATTATRRDLGMVMLIDSASQRMQSIMPGQKLVMVMKLPSTARPDSVSQPTFDDIVHTDLGAADTIAGLPTRHHRYQARSRANLAVGDSLCVVETPIDMEWWISNDATLGAVTLRMAGMRSYFPGAPAQDLLKRLPADKVPRGGMLRLKARTASKGPDGKLTNVEYTTEVTEYFLGQLDASLFDPPEGYSVMDMSASVSARTDSLAAAMVQQRTQQVRETIGLGGVRTCKPAKRS